LDKMLADKHAMIVTIARQAVGPKRAKSHSSNQTYTLNWTGAFTMLNGSTT
jgi:hypothetical protein